MTSRPFAALALLVLPALASAQGTISTQGFGYPSGGLSTRSAAGGGAFGEFDFASLRNPSSTLGWGRGGLYFQYEPEMRSIVGSRGSDETVTARFPVWMAAFQMGPRGMGTLSSSTLLDRTWATRVRGDQVLGSDTVGYEEAVESAGAMNDIRLGVAYSITPTFSIGFGVHAITGENRMTLTRVFDDSVRFGTLFRQLTIGYLGNAVSAGVTWRPSTQFAVAFSARAGGSLDVRLADTLLASGTMAHRVGAAVRYDGLPGASLAVSVDRSQWSNLGEISQTALVASDTWEFGVGLEMTGPSFRGTPSLLYLGYRSRDLPFSVTDEVVSEKMYSIGTGIPVAGPRVIFDVATWRASRGPVAGVSETAWTLSMGFTVRP